MPYRHGLRYVPEYDSWCNMKGRCHNKKHPRYAEWGGKGVTVCDEWLHDFKRFYEDMGPRPTPSHSIDRIDGKKGYSKENCRWATKKEQSENRPTWVNIIEFNGEKKTISELAKVVGIARKSLYGRLESGWSIEEALTTKKLMSKRERRAGRTNANCGYTRNKVAGT